MGTVTLSTEEYEELIRKSSRRRASPSNKSPSKAPRKGSAYSRRYGAAFKRIAPRNKKKNGSWKKGGFARTQKAAHKAAKK